ncbi:unnamed protein product [Absidia cylindrospora]
MSLKLDNVTLTPSHTDSLKQPTKKSERQQQQQQQRQHQHQHQCNYFIHKTTLSQDSMSQGGRKIHDTDTPKYTAKVTA